MSIVAVVVAVVVAVALGPSPPILGDLKLRNLSCSGGNASRAFGLRPQTPHAQWYAIKLIYPSPHLFTSDQFSAPLVAYRGIH